MADSEATAAGLPRLPPEEYTVGWISAIPTELAAAIAMFDVTHLPLSSQAENDENNYHLGSIGKHNVVICCLPCYGTVEAAIASKSMQSTFKKLRFGLMVGIGGGIPSSENDIRLGDVVVSMPSGQAGGVVQYDLGRKEIGEFIRVGSLNRPPTLLLNAINTLRVDRGLGKELTKMVDKAAEEDDDEDWGYPVNETDILFEPTHRHIANNPTCTSCREGDKGIAQRPPRKNHNPRSFYGNIASGNAVMKDGEERDRLAAKEGVLCFEMEAAGLMNHFKCIVIRGICDYADSHKNWSWQRYAASVAAAYAKRLLSVIPLGAVESLEPLNSK
jgi:nucleoside phosphorylase